MSDAAMSNPQAVRKAEAFLGDDPRVERFAVHDTDGKLEVAATAAQDWVAAERAAAHAGLESRILKQWQMVYDRSYRWDKNVRPPNFDAWISGFTGEAIPTALMRIWLDDALERMRSVPHARVLEIGCGVGLVAAALAPGGAAYDGIDLSEEAIASLGAFVASRPDLAHVRLAQRAAHDLDDLDVGGSGNAPGAELAILNSVVQYFPDAAYLVRVLAAAARKLAPGGAIFLGDLRAAALLPLRATAVAAARAKPGARVVDVRAEAVAGLALARELAIDPGFFANLGGAPDDRLPRRAAPRFSLKPAAAERELSGYRYDVMLLMDAPDAAPAPTMAAAPLRALLDRLDADRPEAVAVGGLANARLAADVALRRAVDGAAPDTPLDTLIGGLAADPAAIEPGDLAEEAARRGYAAELRFTPGSPEGRFDALLRRDGVAARWPGPETDIGSPTNDPLGDELMGKLRRELQAGLDTALGGRGLARLALTP